MSRHANQIKDLLHSKRQSKDKMAANKSSQMLGEPVPSFKNLKRSQSAASFRKNTNDDLLHMQEKFKKLQQNYKAVLQQTKSKALLFTKQKKQLQRYKQESEKNKKEIQKLRSLLGFMKKSDFAAQTDIRQDQLCSFEKDMSKISSSSKAEQSTSAELGLMDENSQGRIPKRSSCKQSRQQARVKTPYNIMSNNKSEMSIFRGALKQNNTRSTLSKYKFVPTIAFN